MGSAESVRRNTSEKLIAEFSEAGAKVAEVDVTDFSVERVEQLITIQEELGRTLINMRWE